MGLHLRKGCRKHLLDDDWPIQNCPSYTDGPNNIKTFVNSCTGMFMVVDILKSCINSRLLVNQIKGNNIF